MIGCAGGELSARMFGPAGNPRADKLFEVVRFLQRRERLCFHVKSAPA
jgi:hypothetical protein